MKYGLESFQQLEATTFLILFTQFPRIFTPPQFFARPVSVSFGRVAKWITLAMRVRVPDRGVCCTAEIQFLFHRYVERCGDSSDISPLHSPLYLQSP